MLISTLLIGTSSSAVAQVKVTGSTDAHPRQEPTVSITPVSRTKEVDKPTHFIALTNTGDVVINATLTPSGIDPTVITWSGGVQGASNRQRLVNTSSANTFHITATVPEQSPVMVTIHVLDATGPPPNSEAGMWPVDGGYQPPNCPKGCFGQTFMEIGFDGIVRPSYAVSPYFSADRWVFRLDRVRHVYRWFVQPSGFKIELPQADPATLPLIAGLNLEQSLKEARLDFDTRTRISPTNPTGLPEGPDRKYYWVQSIARNHELAHIYNFYANWWRPAMDLFERIDVEGSGVSVVFDCTNLATTTGAAAIASRISDWDAQVSHRHTTAYDQHAPTAEAYAHMITNPQYEPIAEALSK